MMEITIIIIIIVVVIGMPIMTTYVKYMPSYMPAELAWPKAAISENTLNTRSGLSPNPSKTTVDLRV